VAMALASAFSAALLLEGKKPQGSAEQTIAEEEVGPNPLEGVMNFESEAIA
jgi:hypothetical protein